jgi:FlaG/FlaF family flagellin (archaellin)
MRARPADGEAAVSDVIGSILLVGITVVMAAGFGAVLLSYDGPNDEQHTQLSVSVGPGSDGDWGTNDAEMTLRHLGGEPLRESDTAVRYRGASGVSTDLALSFSNDELSVGESWTATITAAAGEAINVDVIAQHGRQGTLLSTGTASAGGATSTLTYVLAAGVTAVAGWGTVTSAANAGAANDGLDASLQEGSVGGTPTTIALKPSTGTVTQSGASNSNVKLSDDMRAALDTAADYVQGNTFANNPSGVVVSDLTIGFEGRGTRTCSTIAHQATFTGTASGGTTVSSAAITIAAGHTYVAAIATGDDLAAADVTGVSGPLGITWTQVEQVSNGAGTSRLEVWVGTGTASLVGIVTATFGGTIDRAGIAVSRYSNVGSPAIEASITNTATGTSMTTGAIVGTATSGLFYMAVNGVTAGTGTPSDFVNPADGGQRSDLDVSGEVQLDVADGAATASNAGSAGLSASNPWQAIGVTLAPTCTAYTTAQVSYLISGVAAGTPQTFQMTGSDVDTYSINVITDRAWAVADLANLGVRVTLPTTVASSTTEVDLIYITLTTADALTTYRSDFELAFDNVPAGATTEIVQLRYKTNGADSFTTSLWTGSAWRACPGLLNSITYTVFSCTVTLPGEHAGTNPNVRMRIQDSNNAGTTRGSFQLDYARVATT